LEDDVEDLEWECEDATELSAVFEVFDRLWEPKGRWKAVDIGDALGDMVSGDVAAVE
jgi:hypothetical protein